MQRRRLGTLVGAVVAAITLLAGCGRPSQREAPRSIVLITIDTLRADRLTPQLMPAVDGVARQAVVFDQTITVAPLTLPAHASLLTSRFPPRHGVRDNDLYVLGRDVPVWPERLKAHGYATAAFVSSVVLDHRFGLDRGFDLYDDEISGPERPAKETLARAERWLDSAPRPSFVWIHLFEPHAPYRTGSYDGEVKAVDSALSGFFDHLQRDSSWNDTVLSVTADHGESLGEHGEQTHGFFLYDATLRIPWIVRAPGLGPRHVSSLVRIVDEMPTILDMAHVADRAAEVDGTSVAQATTGRGVPAVEAYCETFLPQDQFGWSHLIAIRTDRLKFIDAPQPELYDLVSDPAERTSVAASRPSDASRLRRILGEIVRRSVASTRNASVDPALDEKLLSLGYIGSPSGAPVSDASALADPKSKLEIYNLVMSALEQSERGDLAGALATLDRAEHLDAGVAQVEFLKGTLLGRLGRYDRAAEALERTLALNSGYTAARFKLALAWLRTGHADRAADALREVVRQSPGDFRAWHNLAAIAYSRGDLDEAETLEHKALGIDSTYAEAWNTLGAIALVRKRPAEAIDALTRATTLAPQNAQAFENLSLAFRASGQTDRARQAADRACALDRRFCSAAGGSRR